MESCNEYKTRCGFCKEMKPWKNEEIVGKFIERHYGYGNPEEDYEIWEELFWFCSEECYEKWLLMARKCTIEKVKEEIKWDR
jgi:hypothetical protein